MATHALQRSNTLNVICNPKWASHLRIRGLTQRVKALYIRVPSKLYFSFLSARSHPMNRHSIATNARALPGAAASVCASVRMAQALGGFWFTNAGSRSPGEGDAASP
jgi:hypothetical protein